MAQILLTYPSTLLLQFCNLQVRQLMARHSWKCNFPMTPLSVARLVIISFHLFKAQALPKFVKFFLYQKAKYFMRSAVNLSRRSRWHHSKCIYAHSFQEPRGGNGYSYQQGRAQGFKTGVAPNFYAPTFLASHLIAPKICRLENRSMALRLDEIAAAPKNFNPSARPLAMKINTREFGLNHHS